MNQKELKEEVLKGSKWIRFLFMVLYSSVIYFVLPIYIGLAIVQFLFYLITSKPNTPIANFNLHLLGFFNDSLAFLLFQTEEKPFPFKENEDDKNTESKGEVIEGKVEADISEEAEEVKE
jgi:hypothetical protein